MRCARATSHCPPIDSDDDNNLETLFAESDQSYIKKRAASRAARMKGVVVEVRIGL